MDTFFNCFDQLSLCSFVSCSVSVLDFIVVLVLNFHLFCSNVFFFPLDGVFMVILKYLSFLSVMCDSVFATLVSSITRSTSSSVMFSASLISGPVVACDWIIRGDPPAESQFWRLRISFRRPLPIVGIFFLSGFDEIHFFIFFQRVQV